MKKLIPFLMLMVGATGALAQGIVNFNNNVLISTNPAAPSVLVNYQGSSVAGTQYVAQLYWSTDGGASFTAVTTAPARFRPAGTPPAGTWIGGNRTLPAGVGGVGQTIQLQVQAWDVLNPNVRGQSSVFNYTQEASVPPAASDIWMKNFLGFSLVPEPSVIGLGVIGIGALFLLRRRK
jgi:hypothetical protein